MSALPFLSLLSEKPLCQSVTCPNCWHTFPPESVLWIAVHTKLADERQLLKSAGGYQQRRFIPERFDVEGRALDAEGAGCTQLACPRCKLQIPRASLEMPSVGISVLGAPGSGKSVFLTSMVFSLRQQAANLGLKFQDADLSLNEYLLDDERKMFLDPAAESFRPIDQAVQKTQLLGNRYRTSLIDGHEASFASPYTFLIGPSVGHPRISEAKGLSRLLCIYDNAGEHFVPGTDTGDRPMTRHLAASKGLIYVFDPTKDRRVRRRLNDTSTTVAHRQDTVLIEAANRIREHSGLAQDDPIAQPLVVGLTKFDVWRSLVPQLKIDSPMVAHPQAAIEVLQGDEVESASRICRDFLWENCREVVSAIESISQNVTYVPIAAVGWDVRIDPKSKLPNFHAASCEPFGVTVPLMSLLSKIAPKVVPVLRRRSV